MQGICNECQSMTIQAILRGQTNYPIPLSSTAPLIVVELKQEGTASAYVPYWTPTGGGSVRIDEIEVTYSENDRENFRLRGSTEDGHKPEITKVIHAASSNPPTLDELNSSVEWKYSGSKFEVIEWTFDDPKNVGDWVSWEFAPSSGSPPVRVKVVLKRQV